ncbi:hypothetical protein IQ07DRAFT_416916 [Pyrenochaeta sp. DS3sAY3a]|nr:hypothetical protein IQ07DRAFT_416916 [Pyrenochaeta sp. DS3sAY3a]
MSFHEWPSCFGSYVTRHEDGRLKLAIHRFLHTALLNVPIRLSALRRNCVAFSIPKSHDYGHVRMFFMGCDSIRSASLEERVLSMHISNDHQICHSRTTRDLCLLRQDSKGCSVLLNPMRFWREQHRPPEHQERNARKRIAASRRITPNNPIILFVCGACVARCKRASKPPLAFAQQEDIMFRDMAKTVSRVCTAYQKCAGDLSRGDPRQKPPLPGGLSCSLPHSKEKKP